LSQNEYFAIMKIQVWHNIFDTFENFETGWVPKFCQNNPKNKCQFKAKSICLKAKNASFH